MYIPKRRSKHSGNYSVNSEAVHCKVFVVNKSNKQQKESCLNLQKIKTLPDWQLIGLSMNIDLPVECRYMNFIISVIHREIAGHTEAQGPCKSPDTKIWIKFIIFMSPIFSRKDLLHVYLWKQWGLTCCRDNTLNSFLD